MEPCEIKILDLLPYEIKIADPLPALKSIIFSLGDGNWIMKLTSEGIRFNREVYPNLTNDEAANAIINILENKFKIEFKRKF